MKWKTYTRVEKIKPIPGIYAMYDANDELIYIGQSKSVKDRIYKHPKRAKLAYLKVRATDSIDERTKLEIRLIQRLKPKLNKQLYTKITTEETVKMRLSLREDLVRALRVYATMHQCSMSDACYLVMRENLKQELEFVKEYENGED
tara:strand:+ start:4623 stop:5060 length:438 start_codon:yes stop_codon:yes gene_type:complete